MDRGLVDRASAAGAAPAVRHDPRRGRPGRPGPLVLSCRLAGNGTGIAGGVLILLFQGVGARIPQDVDAPLAGSSGRSGQAAQLPHWWTGQRFTASVVALLARDWEQRLRASRQAVQFLPLVVAQLLAIVAIYWATRERLAWSRPRTPRPGC